MLKGFELTIEARMRSWTTGHLETGVVYLVEKGIDYNDAKDIVFGSKRIIYRDSNYFMIVDDDWKHIDFESINNFMMNALETLYNENSKIINEGTLTEASNALMKIEKISLLVTGVTKDENKVKYLRLYNTLMNEFKKPQYIINYSNFKWI